MTITYTLDHRGVEGNRRVNYGSFTMTSAEVITRTLNTGLRIVDTLEVWDQTRASPTSGVAEPKCTYPTSWPALDSTSGHFTVEFTSSLGPVFWRAKGKV